MSEAASSPYPEMPSFGIRRSSSTLLSSRSEKHERQAHHYVSHQQPVREDMVTDGSLDEDQQQVQVPLPPSPRAVRLLQDLLKRTKSLKRKPSGQKLHGGGNKTRTISGSNERTVVDVKKKYHRDSPAVCSPGPLLPTLHQPSSSVPRTLCYSAPLLPRV